MGGGSSFQHLCDNNYHPHTLMLLRDLLPRLLVDIAIDVGLRNGEPLQLEKLPVYL